MSKQSESIIKLMTALSEFQNTCPVVPKNKKNHTKGMYAGLEDIMGTIRKPLKDAGLVISQLPGDGTLTTLLAHFESGEFVSSTITLSASNKDNPQAVGSALTYARRYTLAAVLGLPIGEEDDDAEKAIVAKPKEKPEMSPTHKDWDATVRKYWAKAVSIETIEKHFTLTGASKKRLIEDATALDLDQKAKKLTNV